ncbi:hypothetical protein [Robbsia andropogonis]|uniref:hypothetical protein n=1 Tax=Robbsia andropogonis TaxID=28092 RepID=UPI0020A13757|nr:hypothetical protein [Robbsia andropogonis]MCP1117018.1 hypothetical protein [Robbsia andropogonis]MCP1126303.1 hypothetical protein [Robbsia andropogonis]
MTSHTAKPTQQRYVYIVEPSAPKSENVVTLGEQEIAEFQRECVAAGRAAALRRRVNEIADAPPHVYEVSQ